MAETTKVRRQTYPVAFWHCPECNYRNDDGPEHIYLAGGLEECQFCGCIVELFDEETSPKGGEP